MSKISERKHTIIQELNQETSKISWLEMQKFFAAGMTFAVAEHLDLLDSVAEIAMDNKSQLAAWMDNGDVARVSDEQAGLWFEQQNSVWAVVLAPYVFVQVVKDAT
jgi:hypothetical protein